MTVTLARVGPGASAAAGASPVPLAAARRRRRAVAAAAAATSRSSPRSSRRSSCAPVSAFLRVRTELDNRCRDHRLRAHFPLPAPVDRLRRRVRVRGRRARPHRRGWPARGAAAHLRLPPLRRRLRRRPTVLALAPRRSARVRGRRPAAPSSRSRCCAPPATSPAPRWRCARTPPVRSIHSRDPQLQGPVAVEYAVLPHRGDLGRRPVSTTSPTRSSSRSSGSATAGTGRPAANGSTAARRRGGDVERPARAGRARRARLQPGPDGDHRRARTRRRPGARLARRPPWPPARALRGHVRARAPPASPPSASTPDRRRPDADPNWCAEMRRNRVIRASVRAGEMCGAVRAARSGGRGRAEQGLAHGIAGRPARREPGAVISAASRRRVPCSGVTSHSSAGWAPCHRSANDTRP